MSNDYDYMAGLIDGEGTIGIARNNSTDLFRAPYVSVTSTTAEIILWLHSNFNGSVAKQKTYQDHHKQSWSWKLRRKSELFHLLSELEPRMLEPVKKARIKLLLSEYDKVTVRNGKYTVEQLAAKAAFEERFLQCTQPS